MAARIETQNPTKEEICLAICQKFDLDPPIMSNGGTVRSELLDRIGEALGLDTAKMPSSYRKFEKLVNHFGGNYDDVLDSSEHSPDGGGTISAHGWRKLAHLSGSREFFFILNHAQAEISEKYSDDFGRSYGFSQSVNGRKGILEAGIGSRVVFYNTANSKSKPQQAFIASARVSSIEFPVAGEYILKFDQFQQFQNPVLKKDIEIDEEHRWNNQNAIAEITQTSFNSILNEGTKLPPTQMTNDDSEFTVDVRPDTGSLRIYRGMTYTPHYALGEFIDNSISSALENTDALLKGYSGNFQLKVLVDFDPKKNRLTIVDNAAGIRKEDIGAALKAGKSRGETRLGLGKYGIGMKAAAFWFGSKLTIVTHPLGEDQGWEVSIDISGEEDLPTEVSVKAIEHRGIPGTTISIDNLWDGVPKTSAINLIGKYLPSIYRSYLSGGKNIGLVETSIEFQGKILKYSEPELLEVQFWPSEDGPLVGAESKIWRQDVRVTLSGDKIIEGWVGILKTMSRELSGLTLFYKDKAITGALPVSTDGDLTTGNEQTRAYKPAKMFGQAGSKIDQSFVGEFDVTHFGKTLTTDLPRWSSEEKEAFEQAVLDAISSGDQSMMKMAKNYRRRLSSNSKKTVIDVATSDDEVAKRTQGIDGKVGHGEVISPTPENQFADSDVEGGIITSLLKDDEGHNHEFVLKLGQAERSSRFYTLRNSGGNAHQIEINVNHPILDGVDVSNPDVRKVIQYMCFGYAASEIFADTQDGAILRSKFNNIMSLLSEVQTTDRQNV
jgi:hypothetical protein